MLYPDGYRGNWNDCRKHATFPAKRENIDDVRFIRTLIARTSFEQAINEKQVYVFGYSNGAHMAFRLATEAADEIAAIVAVSANLPITSASSCPQQGRTSRVMLINGTADPINPYEGGVVTLFGFASRGAVMSSMATAQHFAERNGLTGWPVRAQLKGPPESATSVDSLTWQENGRPMCTLYSVKDGGHVYSAAGLSLPQAVGQNSERAGCSNGGYPLFRARHLSLMHSPERERTRCDG